MFDIDGECAERFSPVREALARNLEDPLECGEAVSIVINGKPVVDLWGGYRDAARTTPWAEDTWACFFSVGKPIVALALGQLIEAGEIALEDRVTDLWPAYGQAGKSETTVDHVLSHFAGIPGAFSAARGSAYDWQAMIAAIEGQAPLWPPGTTGCYHTFTYGHLVGEICRRITGLSIGQLVQARIAGPLELDLGFGLSLERQAQCAELLMTPSDPLLGAIQDPATLIGQCWHALPLGAGEENFNRPECRGAEIPAFNGHGTARSLAKLYSSLAMAHAGRDTEQPFSSPLIRMHTVEQWSAVDALGLDNRMARGFRLRNQYSPFNGGAEAFGHSGIGGALAFGDPALGLGFGFVTNRLAPGPGASPYARRLLEAMSDALL